MAHRHMKLKNPRGKRTLFRFKALFYLSLLYVSFCFSFYYCIKNTKRISNEEFINILVRTGNANILGKYQLPNLVNATMRFFFNIDFTNPSTILDSSILKYGKQKDEVRTIRLEYNDDYSDMEELKTISDYIDDPNPKSTNNPIVYLYNSHQLENYSNSNLEVYGITPNVMMATYVLREKLDGLGIGSIVEDGNMSDILAQNGWNYSYSYQASRGLLLEKKKKYSSLKYFIDIHRDSVGKGASTISINNVNYAKVLFVIGLDYNGWEANYQFSLKLHDMIESKYSGLSRGIMKKTGMNVNGVYNQDVSPNCILIEVGGVENTIEEVYQTMNVLAVILSDYIKGES